ncbi:uncharacterized protein LOC117339836 [Pecten maximus]|uniref:uncharacterized protein LOC117339836 n=1 Tax=Pecten maximus TaxID=6579 RepID=UPI001458DA4D|nr:uncharacterized protein LOC117339836 [Pecten maximus]
MLFLGILMWISAIQAQDSPVLVDNIPLDCGGSNWTLVDTWCIRVFDHRSSWVQANRICRSYESNLVVIADRQHHIDITERVITAPGHYWIGLIMLQNLTGDPWVSETDIASQLPLDTTLDTNGLITKWSSGENGTVLQGYWDIGQPDPYRGSCVYLRGDSQWRWAVGNCDTPRKFICQYAACHQGSFRCSNGVCINDQKRCDGMDDCGDDSDETSCQIVTESDFDEVIVLVGGRTALMSEYVGRYSGTLTNVQVISPNNLLIIKFTSDYSNTFKGFTAQWETVTHSVPVTGLHLVANTSLQEMTSPFYPSFYIRQSLEWIISPTHARHVVTLQVVDLELDEGDYIVVRHDNIDGDVMAVYNYTVRSGIVISVNSLHVMMKVKASYSRHIHRGFRFSYIEGCDIILHDDNGVVFSPGYGVVSYPAYQNCSWTITAAQDRQLTLLFDKDFHLEDGHDFLQVEKEWLILMHWYMIAFSIAYKAVA